MYGVPYPPMRIVWEQQQLHLHKLTRVRAPIAQARRFFGTQLVCRPRKDQSAMVRAQVADVPVEQQLTMVEDAATASSLAAALPPDLRDAVPEQPGFKKRTRRDPRTVTSPNFASLG